MVHFGLPVQREDLLSLSCFNWMPHFKNQILLDIFHQVRSSYFLDTVCLVNSFIFSCLAQSYNGLSRSICKEACLLSPVLQLQSSGWWLLGWEQGWGVCILGWPCLCQPATWSRGLYDTVGTAQAPACSCHLLPPFTSVLTMFGSQDVLSRFVFDFVMCFAHLKMSISVSSSLVVAEVSPAAHYWLLRAHLFFLFFISFIIF